MGNGRDGVFREIDDFCLAVHHVAEKRLVMCAGNRNTIVFNDIGVPFVRSMADGQFAGGKDGGIVADDNRGGLVERRLVKRRHGNRLDGGDGDFAVVHARIDAEAGIIGKPWDDDAFGDPFIAAFVGETSLADRRETGAVEDRDALVQQMREVRQVLFDFTTDNVEEFSSEISTIEDKQELIKLKKVLIAARDCCNVVRTFGDDELKQAFSKLEITRLPEMIREVQRQIDTINQKEAFDSDDSTRQLINEAMQDITFNFSKIGDEELQMGFMSKEEFHEKWRRTIQSFTENIDQDDPEYISIREAFMQRFKEFGFAADTVHEFTERSKALDEVLKKLAELQKRNKALMRKYNGDAKFARVHKRIREENAQRKARGASPIISGYEEEILEALKAIKFDIDQKVFDRNDILKKDAYFEQTVMSQIKQGMDTLGIKGTREDRVFIQSRISSQYLTQYNATYPGA